MPDSLVRLQREDDIAVLEFHNPESRNAMTAPMGEAFAAQIAVLQKDPTLRVVIITGAPEGRAFSAGGDLGMIGGHSDRGHDSPDDVRAEARDSMRGFYGLFLSLRDLPCPTIAAINGHAIGAGLCVTLACDLRVVSREAKLAFNFVRLGIHPGMGATWSLPRIVAPPQAAELLYTGRTLLGDEAERIGLVNRAVEPDQVLPTAMEMAREIAGNAPIAVRGVKRALAETQQNSLDQQLGIEAQEQAVCYETRDLREGLAAVREKRDPRFQGS